VGEGGEIERSEIEPGEGFVSAYASADRDPSPPSMLRISGTLSREERG